MQIEFKEIDVRIFITLCRRLPGIPGMLLIVVVFYVMLQAILIQWDIQGCPFYSTYFNPIRRLDDIKCIYTVKCCISLQVDYDFKHHLYSDVIGYI